MPGLGNLFGGADGDAGPGGRQRFALLVSAATLMGALILVLWLAPRQPPPRPPRDLFAYGEPDLAALVRVQQPALLWKELAQSRVYARARAVLGDVAWARVSAWLPPALADLVALATSAADRELALFVYPGAHAELAAVARASTPIQPTFSTRFVEEYRGHAVHAYEPAAGRAVLLSWRGSILLAASSKPRLERLIARHIGEEAPSVAVDTLFQRAMGGVSPGERVLVYVNVALASRVPSWQALLSRLPRAALGEVLALAASIDPRPRGVRFGTSLVHRILPAWAGEVASWLGNARVLRMVAPAEPLLFAAVRVKPEKALEALGAKAPAWLEPFLSIARDVFGSPPLPETAKLEADVATFGLMLSEPLPAHYAALRVRDEPAARSALAALAARVPGAFGDALATVSRARSRTVDGVPLLARDLALAGGHGVGLHRRWLFGGALPAAEAFAKALAGKRWRPSPLAQEVLSQAAHLWVWLDARAAQESMWRAAKGRLDLAAALRALGRFPRGVREIGFSLRLDADRIVARGFAGFEES
jgi:hypothetical protein